MTAADVFPGLVIERRRDGRATAVAEWFRDGAGCVYRIRPWGEDGRAVIARGHESEVAYRVLCKAILVHSGRPVASGADLAALRAFVRHCGRAKDGDGRGGGRAAGVVLCLDRGGPAGGLAVGAGPDADAAGP